jgi:uncharacterized protein (DUF2267 family)
VQYEELLDLVAREAGIERQEAERAVRATLKTLAQRITGGEDADLAAELPEEVRLNLRHREHPERFDLQEFVRRVAAREGGLIDEATAERHVRAVFSALRQAVSAKEIADMVAQLPKDIQEVATRRTRRAPRRPAPAEGRSAAHIDRP